jgi:hypothetical protein
MLSPSRVIAAKLQEGADAYCKNAAAGRRRMRTGIVGQNVIEWRLREIGVLMVEAVNTPWKIMRVGGRITGAIPQEKVSGDFRGILPGGRSVLVEVKTFDRLTFGAFKKHQHDALNDHHRLGGVSLVGWVCGSEQFILRWPLPDFVPRASLAIETARQLNIRRIHP